MTAAARAPAEFEIRRGILEGPNLLCILGAPKEAGPGQEAYEAKCTQKSGVHVGTMTFDLSATPDRIKIILPENADWIRSTHANDGFRRKIHRQGRQARLGTARASGFPPRIQTKDQSKRMAFADGLEAQGRRPPKGIAMNIIEQLEKEQAAALAKKRAVPEFAPGDTVRVNVKVVEGERTRVQAYEGVCIGRAGGGINENFTVRKISYGEGVERVFPVHSPLINSIEVVRRGRVRRAKLYYLRGRRGKSARIPERQEVAARRRKPSRASPSPRARRTISS